MNTMNKLLKEIAVKKVHVPKFDRGEVLCSRATNAMVEIVGRTRRCNGRLGNEFHYLVQLKKDTCQHKTYTEKQLDTIYRRLL